MEVARHVPSHGLLVVAQRPIKSINVELDNLSLLARHHWIDLRWHVEVSIALGLL